MLLLQLSSIILAATSVINPGVTPLFKYGEPYSVRWPASCHLPQSIRLTMPDFTNYSMLHSL